MSTDQFHRMKKDAELDDQDPKRLAALELRPVQMEPTSHRERPNDHAVRVNECELVGFHDNNLIKLRKTVEAIGKRRRKAFDEWRLDWDSSGLTEARVNKLNKREAALMKAFEESWTTLASLTFYCHKRAFDAGGIRNVYHAAFPDDGFNVFTDEIIDNDIEEPVDFYSHYVAKQSKRMELDVQEEEAMHSYSVCLQVIASGMAQSFTNACAEAFQTDDDVHDGTWAKQGFGDTGGSLEDVDIPRVRFREGYVVHVNASVGAMSILTGQQSQWADWVKVLILLSCFVCFCF